MLLKAKFIQTITIACFLQAALSLPISSDHALLDHTSPTSSIDAGNSQSKDAHGEVNRYWLAQGQNLHRSLDFTGEPKPLIPNTLRALSSARMSIVETVISPPSRDPPLQPRNDTPDPRSTSNDHPSSQSTNRMSLGFLDTRINLLPFPGGDKLAEFLQKNPSAIPAGQKAEWDKLQQYEKIFVERVVSVNFCQLSHVLLDRMRLERGDSALDAHRNVQEMANLISTDSRATSEAQNMATLLTQLIQAPPDEAHHLHDCKNTRDALQLQVLQIALHQTTSLQLRRKVILSLEHLKKSTDSEFPIVVSNQKEYAENMLKDPKSLDQEKAAASEYLVVLKEIEKSRKRLRSPSVTPNEPEMTSPSRSRYLLRNAQES
ncbi:hypothetical protein H0H93_001228 [Arthromyces matolae]|nr:hypothetical protein H0H93_001228 [Arthromyces matolae]